MTTIGVDLHKDSLTAVVLDAQGTLLQRRDIPTKCRLQIQQFFASSPPPTQVAVESVGFYLWFWNLVRPHVHRLVLADPAGVRAHAGRKAKTDRHDALLLATLLREDRLPMAFVPQENVRALRELVRHRHSVARSLARERRALRWLLLKNNLPGPRILDAAAAQKWLLSFEDKLSAVHRFAARQRLDQITSLERIVADAERLIHDLVEADPTLLSPLTLMASVPGIGRLTAVTILVETGDLTRFDTIDQLSAYAGLAPRVSQSGQTVHHGHISKQGPPLLRWVLQQAALAAIRHDPQVQRIFHRIARRAGSKKAATAVARKLLSYAWSVCRRREPFHWPGQPVPPTTTRGWSYEI